MTGQSWPPAVAEASAGRSNLDAPLTEGVGHGAHAVEFSKTVAPLRGGGLPPKDTSPRRPFGPHAKRAEQYSAPRPPSGGDVDVDRPLPRPVVEVDEDDLLPGAQRQLPADHGNGLRRADDR